MATTLEHAFPFDPCYGYDLDGLLAVVPPEPPPGFAGFWARRYDRALDVDTNPKVSPGHQRHRHFRIFDLRYRSTEGFPTRGWLLTPRSGAQRMGLVLGHGYGGIQAPDTDLPFRDAVYLIPCFRGLGCSRDPRIPSDPSAHVLHEVLDPDRYVIGGCVEDLWTGVSALLRLVPRLAGHIGYMGTSLGGGIGALALPWDARIARGHLCLPTFGHQPLRLALPTLGSAAALQVFSREHPDVLDALALYDAACAARLIRQPMHVAAALFDPAVAPPGQFAVYNAIPPPKQLFVLRAGHCDYPGQTREHQRLRKDLRAFFRDL